MLAMLSRETDSTHDRFLAFVDLMAGLLTVETSHRSAFFDKMPKVSAVSAGLGLPRVPDPYKFSGKSHCGRDGPLDSHRCRSNTVEN